jgi:hypothetical protein
MRSAESLNLPTGYRIHEMAEVGKSLLLLLLMMESFSKTAPERQISCAMECWFIGAQLVHQRRPLNVRSAAVTTHSSHDCTCPSPQSPSSLVMSRTRPLCRLGGVAHQPALSIGREVVMHLASCHRADQPL